MKYFIMTQKRKPNAKLENRKGKEKIDIKN